MKKLLFLLLFPVIAQAQLNDFSHIQIPSVTPTITLSPNTSFPTTFTNFAGSASSTQTLAYSFTNLSGSNGSITFPSWIEISLDGGSTYTGTSPITGLGNSSVNALARVKSATTTGSYGPSAITFAATGATSQTCNASATVSPTPALSASPTTVSGVSGTAGSPGTAQTTVVTFASTTVTATPPTNVEVSQDGTTYSPTNQVFSSGSPLTLSMRTTSGAPAGAISGNVVLTGTNGVTTVNVAVSGTVTSGGGSVDTVAVNFSDSTNSNGTTGVVATTGWENWSVPLGFVAGNGKTSRNFKFKSGTQTTMNFRFNNVNFGTDNGSGYNSSTTGSAPVTAYRYDILNTTAIDSFVVSGIPTHAAGWKLLFSAAHTTAAARTVTLTETISGRTATVTVNAGDATISLDSLTPSSGVLRFVITDNAPDGNHFWYGTWAQMIEK